MQPTAQRTTQAGSDARKMHRGYASGGWLEDKGAVKSILGMLSGLEEVPGLHQGTVHLQKEPDFSACEVV